MPLFAGALAGRDNDELRRILCDEVPDAFRWLLALGVRFYGPMPEPPHRQPRMHNVLPNSLSYIYHLGRHARRVGVDVRLGTRVTTLITEGSRVSGVACEDATFHARRGVVLAAGDFTNDPELKSRYMGPQEAKVEGVNVTATGDGQKLALPLGARIINGDLALGPEIRFIPPARTTLVRRLPPWRALGAHDGMGDGSRSAGAAAPVHHGLSHDGAGAVPQSVPARRGAGQPGRTPLLRRAGPPRSGVTRSAGKIGYILIDARLARQFSAWPHFVSTAPGVAYAYVPDYRRNRPDVYTEASSLGELARKLGMDQQLLQTAIAGRNAAVSSVASADGAAAHRAHLSASRPSSLWVRCVRCSSTTKAAWRSTHRTACWARTISRSPVSTRPALPVRAGCC